MTKWLFCLIVSFNPVYSVDIVVEKKGVLHRFVPVDPETDHFTQNVFPNWENETFEVFDKVKDKSKIAIDIGAWIGTTAIWLSNNFHHVVAVDGDRISLDCLEKNLAASGCSNVSICRHPISNRHQEVIFGPRGHLLNESISCIKNVPDNDNDYIVTSITFKQLVYDHIFANKDLNSRQIGFIKCDIEGAEEDIIEDLFYFAYFNKAKIYLSFHIDWWKSKKIEDFGYILNYFSTNCPIENVGDYLKANPFASLLFEPIETSKPFIKENIPAVVISYNQFTYTQNMVKQLEKLTSDIIVVDNNSSFAPLLDYFENDFKYTLLRQNKNHGYTVYEKDFVQKLVGDTYILTDPDLQFNPKLPKNAIKTLINISNHLNAGRVGFALLIDADDIRTDITHFGCSIKTWESQYWTKKVSYPPDPTLKLYQAPIDTTFCLINHRRNGGYHIRVAGDYTCVHIPWHINFQKDLSPGEYESYLRGNISSNWFK